MNLQINELERKVAGLESQLDLFLTERAELDQMLVRCGFPEGITTLKATVAELLSEECIQS